MDNSNKRLAQVMEKKRMYDHDCPSQTLGCSTRQVDIKQQLTTEIKYIENDIENKQEQLRVQKEKLKLIEKNKDLEAYINLLNR